MYNVQRKKTTTKALCFGNTFSINVFLNDDYKTPISLACTLGEGLIHDVLG